MKKVNFLKNRLMAAILILLILVVLIFGFIWLLNSRIETDDFSGAFDGSSKVTASITKIDGLIKFLSDDILSDSIFSKLKPFFTLPVTVKKVGNDNPFGSVPLPEEL